MELEYIGRVTAAKGYQGSILIVDTPAGLKRITAGNKIRIGFSQQFSREYTIKKWQETEKGILINLKEIQDNVEAEKLKEQGVFADPDLIKYKKDESYYIREIMDCSVIDHETGKEIGKISDVWLLPGNDVWVVKNDSKEIPLPVIDEVIKKVDLRKKVIEVIMIPGIEDL